MKNGSFLIKNTEQAIEGIRLASRQLVREFGFLGQTIAGSTLSASGVHALIEIDYCKSLTSKELSDKLLLEKSTISRLIKSLNDKGYLTQVSDDADARVKSLRITTEGYRVLDQINQYARKQVLDAISPYNLKQQQKILNGLSQYACSLKRVRNQLGSIANDNPVSENKLDHSINQIYNGYLPSILGAVVAIHANFYSQFVSFGSVFEAFVASGMAEFLPRLEHIENQIWYAKDKNTVIASISIDGQAKGNNVALLRWFIVDPSYSGMGLGKKLMSSAMLHCEAQGFDSVELWTFSGLDAARSLYESVGFELIEEQLGDQWGEQVLEQKFVKKFDNAQLF